MRYLKTAGLVFLAVVAMFLYWRLGFQIGLPLLLLVISLAIVGPGNRLLWAILFPLPVCALLAAAYLLFGLLPEKPELPRLLALFVLATVVPGAVLWAATKFKALRRRSIQSVASEA